MKSWGDEMSGDEMSEDEMSGDEMSEDEMSGDEMSEDEMSGDEMSRYPEMIFHFLEYCILNIVYSNIGI